MADSEQTTRFLTSDDVDGLATMREYVSAVRDGYRDRGHGAPARPRTTLHAESQAGMLTGYTAILPEVGAMGGYTYAAGFDSADAHFVLPLFDADSGEPLAVFDGASLNPFKTGATGGVAIDELAPARADTLALFGSGPQARAQLKAAATVREIGRVEVYSPTADHRMSFAAEMNEQLDATVAAVASPSAAVEGADIVVTATNASEPVFDGSMLEPGTHVTTMGQYHPEKREVDDTTIETATYVPDLRDRVMNDAGSFIHAVDGGVVTPDHVHAELGEVVVGTERGRTSDDEITLFDSGGTAIETVAAAKMLYERARERNLGTEIEFAPASEALTGR
jgi:alanine dehydrogenase